MSNFDEILEVVKKNPDIKVKVEHVLIEEEGFKNPFSWFSLFECTVRNLTLCFNNKQLAEILQNGEWEVQP